MTPAIPILRVTKDGIPYLLFGVKLKSTMPGKKQVFSLQKQSIKVLASNLHLFISLNFGYKSLTLFYLHCIRLLANVKSTILKIKNGLNCF
jgi:hypothetical protein